MPPARLVLEDGTVYEGESFGAAANAIGEVVFNTSLTGYQEIATDPSYRFQIVVMTYPHIGNYGIEASVAQSEEPQVAGFVVRDAIDEPSNARSEMSLAAYFAKNRISAIQGIDTRALTRKIRTEGAMRGMITSDAQRSVDDVVAEVRRAPSMSGLDLVQRVTALRPYPFDEQPETAKKRIAVYDFGVKRDILRQLVGQDCDVTVYPATTHASEILNQKFDGVLLSNGPGDPEPVTYAQENIRHLVGKVPLFGICLGHQLLGLALGGSQADFHLSAARHHHHGARNAPGRDVGIEPLSDLAEPLARHAGRFGRRARQRIAVGCVHRGSLGVSGKDEKGCGRCGRHGADEHYRLPTALLERRLRGRYYISCLGPV